MSVAQIFTLFTIGALTLIGAYFILLARYYKQQNEKLKGYNDEVHAVNHRYWCIHGPVPTEEQVRIAGIEETLLGWGYHVSNKGEWFDTEGNSFESSDAAMNAYLKEIGHL